jgi:hypothetical protein
MVTSLLIFATSLGCSQRPTDTPSDQASSAKPSAIAESATAKTEPPGSDTQEFTDAAYGYSVHVPKEWKRLTSAAADDPAQRVAFVTPLKSSVIVSIHRLPQAVTQQSTFESIAEEQVDPIVSQYRQAYALTTIVGEDKQDRSDGSSMRFWQGTSALHEGVGPTALISLHAVKYGSPTMINILYVHSGEGAENEMRTLDSFMNTLSFTNPH